MCWSASAPCIMQPCSFQSDPMFAFLILIFSSSSVSKGASSLVLSFCLPWVCNGIFPKASCLQVYPSILLVLVGEFILFFLVSISRVVRLVSLTGMSLGLLFPASQHETVAGFAESSRMDLLVRLLMVL